MYSKKFEKGTGLPSQQSPAVNFQPIETPIPPVEPNTDIFGPSTAQVIHPAIDVIPGGITVGIPFQEYDPDGESSHLAMVIMKDGVVRVEIDPESVTIGGEEFRFQNLLVPVQMSFPWSREDIEKFISNQYSQHNIYLKLKEKIKSHLDLSRPEEYGMMAIWIISTYFNPMFNQFPYLFFLGPKESGKSNALIVSSLSAFNALKIKDSTESSLGIYLNGCRGTVLFDQAENLPGKMVGILADAYKTSGGKRMITQYAGGKRTCQIFSLYGPKGFASTEPLDLDLMDRCLLINMRKTNRGLTFLDEKDPGWQDLRNGCYRFLVCKSNEVLHTYRSIPKPSSRRDELWGLLEAVGRVLGVPDAELEKIRQAFFESTQKTKAEVSQTDLLILQALYDKATKAASGEFVMTAQGIQALIAPSLNKKDIPSVQTIGKKLVCYDLHTPSDKIKRTRRKEVNYKFSGAKVKDIAGRYL